MMIKLFTVLCFSIIVGHGASSDGALLLGHNEDDKGAVEYYLNSTPQGLWTEVPGFKAADSFLNRWGVAIVSDNCKSREDREDYTAGGVLYDLRYSVYEFAHSAREAVDIIGRIVESRGYCDSGRSYMVADAREAWVVAVVRGRHWVAQRVPDDAVMTIPNYYVIGEVDLSDSKNFLACPDLVEYAVERGWYDPDKDGAVNFRNAYAQRESLVRKHNTERHQTMLEGLGVEYDPENVPFCVRPASKIDASKIESLLSKRPVLASGTIYSNVFSLTKRSSKMFFCPGKPFEGGYEEHSLADAEGRRHIVLETPEPAPKGHLVIIGGGDRTDDIMDRFFELGGGKDKPFVAISTAADNPEKAAASNEAEFHRRGVGTARCVAPSREQADCREYVDSLLNGVQGIYFSGGSQYRISETLRGTLLHERMMQIYRDGGVIGGSSAGAGMMADPMISRNHIDSKDIPVEFIREKFVYVMPGMGFLPGAIIDQHFLKYNRANRAFAVALEYPDKPLVGIDESTAVIVSDGTEMEVVGESCVVVMEADKSKIRKNSEGLLGTDGMTVRILLPGDKYSLK